MCALRRLCRFARLCAFGELCALLRSSHYPHFVCITSPTATLLTITIAVIDADERAAEGQYFTEGDEH